MENIEKSDRLDRDLFLCDYIDEKTTGELIESIIKINVQDAKLEQTQIGYKREERPIRLHMTTGGGSAVHTIALFDQIKHSATPVWIYISGYCCSGGFYMLGAADKVIAYEHTQLMYHQLSSEMEYEKLATQKEIVNYRDTLQKVLDSLILENTKITKDKLEEINSKKQDWWMDVTEAKKLGVIDEIIK